jgi:octaprenyl-diphosphate synthase
MDKPEKRKMIYTLKNENKNPEKVGEIIQKVISSGGIDYSRKRMFEFRDKALDILSEMPGNEANKALESLVRYTTDRSY